MSDDEILDWHCADLHQQNLRSSTIQQRRYTMGRVTRGTRARLLEVTPRQLSEFLGRPLAPNSRAVETTHVRRFYEWAVDVELLDLSPARRLRRPRVPSGLPMPVSEPDAVMAIDLAPAPIRAWLLLAAHAGLRCCEIGQLRAEDLWWDHDPALIVINEAKGGSTHAVPMSDHLVAELQDCWLPLSGWLFPRRDGKPGHVPSHLVSQRTNRYLRSIGITHTMHKFRHRFGTQLLIAAGGNLRLAQEGLRHASIKSTQGYTFVDQRDLASAINRIPVTSRATLAA